MNKLLSVSFVCILLVTGCSGAEDKQATSNSNVNEDQESQDNQENKEDEPKDDTSEPNDQDKDAQKDEGKDDEGKEPDTSAKEEPTLTKEEAKEVVIQAETSFKGLVTSTEGDTSKIKGYKTKSDIVTELQTVMSKDFAQSLTDAFFVMRDGELFLEPKGGPLWFSQDQPFTLKHTSEQQYVILQEQNNEMSGKVVMQYIVTYNGEKWVLDEMKSKQKDQSDSLITEDQAVDLVREHVGAQKENVKIEVDHTEENRYVVQVYEVVEQEGNTHTATKGWYYVDQDTGRVTSMMQ